ncbi:DUF2516 family protein [Marmoricola endophyticus]|uniref:DUF2516 family protein n=1 Tax=Marmoricola endophyticus TaxID=2040280 RepID=UPI00166AC641|nr:DUF2516 family protein [Marmoricola endophyticus]
MSYAFEFQNLAVTAILLVIVAGTAWALIDALTRNPQAFVAADKQQKNTWLLILGICLAVAIFLPGLGLFIGAVGMLVYHLDVRPALARVTRRR